MGNPTNQIYIDAYNEYLKTHNLTETDLVYINYAGRSNFPIDKDMFLNFLYDAVALRKVTDVSFVSPLEKLYSDSISLGALIEDIRTVLPFKDQNYGVKDFETDVANPFQKSKKKVDVIWHRINHEKKILVTVTYEQFISAFTNTYGINSLVNSMINDIYSQKYAWEYNAMKNALSSIKFATKRTVKTYAELAVEIKNIATDFKSYDNSHKYNRSVIPTPTQMSNVYIIMAEKWKNKMDVNYFTGLFNVSFAEIQGRILYVDYFENPKTVCVICDERGLYFKKVLDTQRKIENPGDLTRNDFLHFWRMISTSSHFNAVRIDYDEDTVTAPKITIDGVDYTQDENIGVTATKTVTLSANGATNVKYSVDDTALVSLSDTAQVTVTDYKTIRFEYDGGESMYAIRVQTL